MFCYLFLVWALTLGHSSDSFVKHGLSRFSPEFPKSFFSSETELEHLPKLQSLCYYCSVFIPTAVSMPYLMEYQLYLYSPVLSQGIFINSHADFRGPLCTTPSYPSTPPWKFQLFQETGSPISVSSSQQHCCFIWFHFFVLQQESIPCREVGLILCVFLLSTIIVLCLLSNA